ncbi:MAG TPA: hypothetical protein VGR78_10995 [Verrucomicrobiae bacterium]|jgi:hypothetical protein|nr:hypothetical protein [Verrucomicrobiae bacterium]
MSLINDALKRATVSRLNSQNTSPNGESTPALQPVFREEKPSSVLPLVLCIVGIGALLIAGGLWLKAKGTPPESKTAAANETTASTQPRIAGNGQPPVTGAPAAPRNPIERAAETLEKVQQRNVEGEAEADKMVASAPAKIEPKTASTPVIAVAAQPTETSADRLHEASAPAKAIETPTYKLQAIYYRLKGPTVVINGKTVRAGDLVDGAKVVAIQRTSADIEYNGSKKTLHVP